MFKHIARLFVQSFCVKLVLLSFMIFLIPVNAAEDDKPTQDKHHARMRKQPPPQKASLNRQLQQLKRNERQRNYHWQARDQLKTFVRELGQKKDDLQQSYMYWSLSSAHAVYSVYNSSEDALYRCLHAAITIAPYATPYLPTRAQFYYQQGLNGAGFILEGIRALVYTKRWAWEQILGYTCICFMKTKPELIQSKELQGGIYFFFKAAGFYRLNFSLPYLPDSLWQELRCYSTSCHADIGEAPFPKRPNMSKNEKIGVYKALESAYQAADYCQQDNLMILDKAGISGHFRKEIATCQSVVASWEGLRPKVLGNDAFSIDPSSNVLIVNQRQYAIANMGDSKQVLVTANLMKCVGIALYNFESNTCGLVHLDGENVRYLDAYLEGKVKPQDNINDIERFVFDVAGKSLLNKIRATIVSGYSAHINYFKEYLKILGINNVEIIHNSEWGKAGNGYEVWELDKKTGARTHMVEVAKGSIAIDCQTGMLSSVSNEPEIRTEMGMPPNSDEKPHGLERLF